MILAPAIRASDGRISGLGCYVMCCVKSWIISFCLYECFSAGYSYNQVNYLINCFCLFHLMKHFCYCNALYTCKSCHHQIMIRKLPIAILCKYFLKLRSEERRVGKECR